jgi:endonuclease YncB( thermonuclease family)
MFEIRAATALAICPATGARHECVHDGDTVWLAGEKLRIENVDTPGTQLICQYQTENGIVQVVGTSGTCPAEYIY